ncbi:MAG: deoxyribodipyrimidine photo-lyase [Daejeonella sp.]|uniref:cryptochrome/photolyase family protein n=1 Tax=Daejeonella sp. TaxID=2805397 RepID=UPI003C765D91
MKQDVSICWFRRDLRFDDNTALYHALQSPYPVLPVFIFDPEILDKLPDKSDKRVSFIHQTLEELNARCHQNQSTFQVLFADVENAFRQLVNDYHVKEIFLNHDYEPYAIKRDLKIKNLAESFDIKFNTFKDQVIFEKTEVVKADCSPYTVFTPYSKKWKELFNKSSIQKLPSENYLANLFKIKKRDIPSLNDLGFQYCEPEIMPLNIGQEIISSYHQNRNLPSVDGTSQVSPHLRFGTLSIRYLVEIALKWNETWLNELIWREFFMMILYHFPHVVNQSFKSKYDNIPWRNNEAEFESWCRGETGYPIVDAGMRQLNQTGWMHNRVRMIVAGFLTKHLLIDWRWGEAYFAQKLLDYDLSSNNGNWQWAAGSGCDSAPYFRIFNPASQTQKFDPKLIYIKTWVKDFNKYHLRPIVDHDFARKRALEVYKKGLNEV